MTLPRFFLENQVIAEETNEVFPLRLSYDDIKHARALRLNNGERLVVIDAVQDYFVCEIVSFDQDAFLVRISSRENDEKLRPSVVLVQGLAKGEKMDTIIRQATELGVGAFIPFECSRSIVKLDQKKAFSKTNRWRAIAKSAAMQSGQPSIPEVTEPMVLSDVCSFIQKAHVVLICWEEESQQTLRESLRYALSAQMIPPEDARIVVVVGPEGGLEQNEVKALCEANRFASTVSLGASILRTETAGIIAPALALSELGFLG